MFRLVRQKVCQLCEFQSIKSKPVV